jgi:hypothetical protein
MDRKLPSFLTDSVDPKGIAGPPSLVPAKPATKQQPRPQFSVKENSSHSTSCTVLCGSFW